MTRRRAGLSAVVAMLACLASSREARAAESNAARTLSFHGLGMNLEAMTTRLRTPGSAARSRPMMRSLSPPP